MTDIEVRYICCAIHLERRCPLIGRIYTTTTTTTTWHDIFIFIRVTCPFDLYPITPHFYVVKLKFTGVINYFLIFALKQRMWVLVRTALPRKIRKISRSFSRKFSFLFADFEQRTLILISTDFRSYVILARSTIPHFDLSHWTL